MIHSDKFPDLGQVRDRNCFTGLEIAFIGMIVAGTAMTAVSAISQGNAAKATAEANAAMLRRSAALEEQQGQTAYLRKQREGLILRGRSLGVLSAAGVDPGQGSPLELISEQAKESEFQAAQARFVHQQRAWQMRVGAVQQSEAGAMAETQGYLTAAGAVVGGGAKIGGAFAGGGAGTPGGGAKLTGIDKEIADWSKYGTNIS